MPTKKPKDRLSRLAQSVEGELDRYSDSLSGRVASELWEAEDTELSEGKWREWALAGWAKDPQGFPQQLKAKLGPVGFLRAYSAVWGVPRAEMNLANVSAKAALGQLPHQQLFAAPPTAPPALAPLPPTPAAPPMAAPAPMPAPAPPALPQSPSGQPLPL